MINVHDDDNHEARDSTVNADKHLVKNEICGKFGESENETIPSEELKMNTCTDTETKIEEQVGLEGEVSKRESEQISSEASIGVDKKRAGNKSDCSIFEKLYTAIISEKDTEADKIYQKSKKEFGRNDSVMHGELPVSTKFGSDVSQKHFSAKYTCVGLAQLISRPVVTTAKSSATASSFSSVSKRTEKFVIKNISKVSKVFKVSNLTYKIKPVRKNLPRKGPVCPIIYVGEPAFVDLDDFSGPGIQQVSNNTSDVTTTPLDVKEESLYDISALEKIFVSSDKASTSKSSYKKPYPCPDMPHPTLNARQKHLQVPVGESGVLISLDSNSDASKPVLSDLVHPAARRVPSENVPNTKLKSMPVLSHSSVSGVQILKTVTSVSDTEISCDKRTPTVVSVVPKLSVTTAANVRASPVIAVKTSQTKGTLSTSKSTNSINIVPSRDIMTVKLLPGTVNLTSVAKTRPIKPSFAPVRMLPASALNNITSTIKLDAGRDKKSPKVVFVSAKTDVKKPITVVSKAKPSTKENPASSALVKIINLQEQGREKVDEKKENLDKRGEDQAKVAHILSPRPLREGVEIAFEDGVRHFVTNLKQMTHLDDEPIKSWSELKKGIKVAAKWTDGLVYDATVIGCYFPAEKRPQTIVELEKNSNKVSEDLKTRKENSNIRCTKCKKLFTSITSFRKHQKNHCNRPGVIVPNGVTKVTDFMVKAANELIDASNNGKADKRSVGQTEAQMIKCDSNKPPRKKRKIKKSQIVDKSNSVEGFIPTTQEPEEIFQVGTKFLHRWQLDDGSRKWYQGEVLRVVSNSKAFLDCEFEVSYKGEKENYILKLYEDYPTDIRIMGKT